MKNREYFLREDLKTYKPKFILVCIEEPFKIKKLTNNKIINYGS